MEQLKNSPGGISLPGNPTYEKHAKTIKEGNTRGFGTPSKNVELYYHSFAANGIPALPEYVEPALSPISRPDIAADCPLVLINAKFTTFVHSHQSVLSSLLKASPQSSADIHTETALRYGIKNKEWIIVESPWGRSK